MRPRIRRSRSCTYAVAIAGGMSENQLQAFAQYLSTLAGADCDVLVLDSASPDVFDSRRCVLRWVGRHVAVGDSYRTAGGFADWVRAAAELAATEKVIVASAETRYSADEVQAMCDLLERHDVVEPEEYVGAIPWWGGVEAGGMLLVRGIDDRSQNRSTFGFRRSAYRPLRGLAGTGDMPLSVEFAGAEIHEARDVFVRREPAPFLGWVRGRSAGQPFDPSAPVKGIFFFGVLPLLIALALAGGIGMAGGYAGAVALASVVVAIRGRIGAGRFFAMTACLLAPLWIVERSISVYWSMFARWSGAAATPSTASAVRGNERAASGQ